MSGALIGEVLGAVLGGSRGGLGGALEGGLGGALGGMLGGGTGGALGGVLGGMFAGRGASTQDESSNRGGMGSGMLVAVLLPLAMRWVQQNGGVGALVDRLRGQGLGAHADSWLSTGANQPIDADAVRQAVGPDEISQMAQRAGVSEEEVADGLTHILPQVVDKLSPQGALPVDADDALGGALSQLEWAFSQATSRMR
jgi:uncharacterized protein YidB (DUF937 family)